MKNTRELRERLLSHMVDVAEGEMTTEVAKGICNLSQQVYNTLNIELKMAVAKDKIGNETITPVSFDE